MSQAVTLTAFSMPIDSFPGRRRGRDVVEKFWNRFTVDESGCWIWHGAVLGRGKGKGYGRIAARTGGKRRSFLAHRLSYMMMRGPIPDGMCVCHRCDRQACVNPSHLFLGTPADNNKDAAAKGRTQRGEARKNARLTVDDVVQIRKSTDMNKDIAIRFGVSAGAISGIRLGNKWKHVCAS